MSLRLRIRTIVKAGGLTIVCRFGESRGCQIKIAQWTLLCHVI